MSAQLIPDMSFEDYLALPALSATGMKQLLDCPARFHYYQQHVSTSSPAMVQGSLTHHMVLGSDVEYVVKDWDARTSDGKARAAEVAETGAVIVSRDVWDTAVAVADAVMSDPLARTLMESGPTEQTILWTDADTGVDMKCRLDVLPNDRHLIPDLKTARSARPSSFARSEADYGYAIQRAQQVAAVRALDPFSAPECVLVAVETKPPHLVSVVGMSEVDMSLARGLREKAIRLYAECEATDNWPGYSDRITYPEAPAYWRINAEEALGLSSEIEIA